MNELIDSLISLAIGFIAGLIIGFALRKVIKVLLIVGGVMLLVLVGLQGMGWIQTDYNQITVDAQEFVNNTQLMPQINTFTNNFSPLVLLGLAVGGIVGFIRTS